MPRRPRQHGFVFLSALLFCSAALLGCARAAPPAPRLVHTRPSVAPETQRAFDAAFAHYEAGKWEAAERELGRFVTEFADSALVPEARFRRGVCLNRLGHYEEARLVLRDFLEKHPTSSYVHQASVELALSEAKLGNREEADQILRPAVRELSPEERRELGPTLEAVAGAGSAALEAGRRAATSLARAGTPEEREQAGGELVRVLDERMSFAEVATLLEELSEGHPAFPFVAAKHARALYHLGDTARARQVAQRALPRAAGFVADRVREILDRLELRENARPDVIGVILPLSGRFRSFGEAVRDGIELAITARDNLKVLYRDSQNDPDLAVALVEELVREGAIAIIGPVGTGEAAPAAARAQELGVPIVLLSRAEGVPAIGSYVFRNSLTNSAQGTALARYVTQVLGAKAAAILAPGIPVAEELSFAFWDELEQAGGEVRGYETFTPDQTTFAATIKRLVARDNLEDREEFRAEVRKIQEKEKDPYRRRKLLEKAASQQPPLIDFDVLLLPADFEKVGLIAPALAVEDVITTGCDERELERIRKTTRREDLRHVVMLGGVGWSSPKLLARGGRYVNCSVFVDGFYAESEREPTRRFVEAFSAQFGRKPGLFEAQAFDTARIVREIALKRPEGRDAFRAALAAVRKFPGATGETSFGPDGEADKPLFFLMVEKGAVRELDVRISAATQRAANPEPVSP